MDTELVVFDLVQLEKDITAGMYFDSSIPQGYGVGSSGALVAALYDKYAQDKITVLENLTREKLLKLKAIFSKMESFFHDGNFTVANLPSLAINCAKAPALRAITAPCPGRSSIQEMMVPNGI